MPALSRFASPPERGAVGGGRGESRERSHPRAASEPRCPTPPDSLEMVSFGRHNSSPSDTTTGFRKERERGLRSEDPSPQSIPYCGEAEGTRTLNHRIVRPMVSARLTSFWPGSSKNFKRVERSHAGRSPPRLEASCTDCCGLAGSGRHARILVQISFTLSFACISFALPSGDPSRTRSAPRSGFSRST